MSRPLKWMLPLRRDQPRQRQAERGLARSGLADHAERLPGAHVDVDAVDRLHMADRAAEETLLDREPDANVAPFHHRPGAASAFGRRAFRLGRQQVAGIVMLRVGEDLRRRSGLDDLALGHHADAVGDLAHDAEVVGDEQHRHAVLRLQPGEQFEDLRLHGHVERRRRLVGDQQLRLVGQRHGDHHALALAAGELVRIGAEPLFRLAHADFLEQLQRSQPRLPLAHALVQAENLADLLLDRVQRVERGHRLLEDHGDLVAAHPPQLLFA